MHEKYGAPQTFWIRYAVSQDQNDTIEVRLILLNKTATRLPEAMWFTFDTSAQDPNWQHNILGEWEDPMDVQDGASLDSTTSQMREFVSKIHSSIFA